MKCDYCQLYEAQEKCNCGKFVCDECQIKHKFCVFCHTALGISFCGACRHYFCDRCRTKYSKRVEAFMISKANRIAKRLGLK